MVRIFSSPNAGMVHLAKHHLEEDGFECVVRGENLAIAIGGAWWIELWLVNDEMSDAALSSIGRLLEEESDDVDDPWICPDCIEWREGQYSHCWKCGARRLD